MSEEMRRSSVAKDETQKLPAAHTFVTQSSPQVRETALSPMSGQNGVQHETPLVSSRLALPAEITIQAGEPSLSQTKLGNERKKVEALQDRCRQLVNTLFWQKQTTMRSLGFTSAIKGEGKTFLATLMASVLAEESAHSVLLVECTWDEPQFQHIFNCAARPGLAELLRGECRPEEILHPVAHWGHNLIVVPAGDGGKDVVKLLQLIRQREIHNLFGPQFIDSLFLLDLPAALTSPHGLLAAELAETLCLVVRSGVTSEALITEAYAQLKHLELQGVILNEVESKIPRWLRQLL